VSYGLEPRPQLSADEMAALVVAVQEVVTTRTVLVVDPVPSWRFSGRWFNTGPYANRRPYRAVEV
jgi:hypothetical protein